MLTAIWELIKILSALIDLIKVYRRFLEEQRKAKEKKKETDQDKAIDEMEKAKTEEEFDNAQDGIVRNKP